MPGYVVTAVYDVSGARIPSGREVLADEWGPGHRFSYCDGRVLTLVAEAWAADRAPALAAVLSRAERLWRDGGGDPLPAPTSLRIQAVVPHAEPVPGAVGRGPDRVFAESTARLAARLRATRAALADLESQLSPWAPVPAGAPLDEPRSLPDVEALLPPARC
jgi:hypothetical protein